mmetsp:Transcript_124317/g.357232  ORF Transcript_124317/g.357232 Transcript_124317/m.357232 type:complete len:282 (-) Transcript_124317:547-1392(-)
MGLIAGFTLPPRMWPRVQYMQKMYESSTLSLSMSESVRSENHETLPAAASTRPKKYQPQDSMWAIIKMLMSVWLMAKASSRRSMPVSMNTSSNVSCIAPSFKARRMRSTRKERKARYQPTSPKLDGLARTTMSRSTRNASSQKRQRRYRAITADRFATIWPWLAKAELKLMLMSMTQYTNMARMTSMFVSKSHANCTGMVTTSYRMMGTPMRSQMARNLLPGRMGTDAFMAAPNQSMRRAASDMASKFSPCFPPRSTSNCDVDRRRSSAVPMASPLNWFAT